MKFLGLSLFVFVLAAIPAIPASVELESPVSGVATGGSFVNGTWTIKDSNGNKKGTAVIKKAVGEDGTITVTDNNGATYTGTVTSNGSGSMSYTLSPAGSPMGSAGTIVQTATTGTLSFNDTGVPGTDADGTLNS